MARIAPTGRQSGDLQLYRVTDDVYLYRGFFSNSAVLVLSDCVVVVDTQITPRAGERLRQAIARVTDKPVTHVVNTHYHGDHAGGNSAFAGAEIIATAETARYVDERDGERLDYARTFGLIFQDVPAVAPPTRTFTGELELAVGGERLRIFQAGRVETPDACVLYWPRRAVLCCGDGIATVAYPYLGVPFLDEGLRDDGEWIGFLQQMRGLEAEYVLAGHGTALIGKTRVKQRLDLLIALFTDLFAAVRSEVAKGTPLAALVPAVDAQLHGYARHRDLAQNTVSQRFAILRAYSSVHPERRGRGWWELKPSVVTRAPADRAAAALAGLDLPRLSRRARRLAPKHLPLAHALVEAWIAAHPGDAAAEALLAELLFAGSARIQPVVDATEYIKLATAAAERALAIDPEQPLGLLMLGALEIWSAIVLAQSMDRGLAKLERALATTGLNGRQRRMAQFFVGKAHQYELRDAESDVALARALPGWVRWLFPLLRKKLRATP
jgi:cyclase